VLNKEKQKKLFKSENSPKWKRRNSIKKIRSPLPNMLGRKQNSNESMIRLERADTVLRKNSNTKSYTPYYETTKRTIRKITIK